MAKYEHTYSGFNGEPMSRREAEQKVADIRTLNAKVGAHGFQQEIVKSGNGYKVVETRKSGKK